MGFLERRRRAGRSRRRHRASRQRSPSLPLTTYLLLYRLAILLRSRIHHLISSSLFPPLFLYYYYYFFFFCSLSYSYPVRSSNTSLSRLEGRERLGPYEAFLNGKESDAVERSTARDGGGRRATSQHTTTSQISELQSRYYRTSITRIYDRERREK